MNSFNGAKSFTVLVIDGQEFTFDLSPLRRNSPLGSDEATDYAMTLLSRCLTLEQRVRTNYERVKFSCNRRYWTLAQAGDFAALHLAEKQKPTESHFGEYWLDHQDEYVQVREQRFFLEELRTALTTAYIPWLRDVATQSSIGEKQQNYGRAGGSQPMGQPALPDFSSPPVEPPAQGVPVQGFPTR